MNYQLYRFCFSNGVHFGSGSLDRAECTFCADTLFSALCQEAVKIGEGTLNALVDHAKNGTFVISDAFPQIGDELFLPKPALYVERKDGGKEDSSIKKAYKKMKYIPVSWFDQYLRGDLPLNMTNAAGQLGVYQMKTSTAVRGLEEPSPYRVRFFCFHRGNGLYIIFGYEGQEEKELMEELLEYLALDGLGGKRSSGLGRFECVPMKMAKELERRLEKDSGMFMTLSASLPGEGELEEALEGANYMLLKRSGFVASERYAPEWMRKKDAYLFAAGSCFLKKYQGCVLDVSSRGTHPVYRYAKPVFLGVDL